MSAIFTTKDSIDLIVSGAIELALVTYLPPANAPVLVTSENADDFGRMLWTENRRALVTRYTDRCNGAGMAAQIESYRFRYYIGVRPAGIYAVAKFLDYQCNEDSSYERSTACLALRAIIGAVLTAHTPEKILSEAEQLPFMVRNASDVAAYLVSGAS